MRNAMTITTTVPMGATWGDACPAYAAAGPVVASVTGAVGIAVTDERHFVGTPAWSPPDR